MACRSRSPSGRGGRLICELLKEQQEPFLLDVYLLENGHSKRLLTTLETSSMCWPIGACNKLKKLTSNGFKKSKKCGFLKIVCTRFLHVISFRETLLNWHHSAFESGRFSSSHYSGIGGKSVGDFCQSKSMNFDETKQFSPVPILELNAYDDYLDHYDPHVANNVSTLSFDDLQRKSLNIFEELIRVAYTSEFYQISESKEVKEKIFNDDECLTNEESRKDIHKNMTSTMKQKQYMVSIKQLLHSEFSSCKSNWIQSLLELIEIVLDVEAVIFEGIKEETVLVMLDCNTYSSSL